MRRNEIKMPYGYCKELRRPCPCPDDPACGIDRNYSRCSHFEKKGVASAIEEIDVDGKRRVYFKTAEAFNPVVKKVGFECNSASSQGILGDRIGWQKITRPGRS